MEPLNNIKKLRVAKRLTLKDVAEKLGTTPPTIQKLELGVIRLSTDWIMKLVPILEASPSEIAGFPDPASSGAAESSATPLMGIPNTEKTIDELDTIPFIDICFPSDDNFLMLSTVPDDIRPRPYFLKGVSNAYALKFPIAHMEPRIREDSILFINPNSVPKKNDIVVVKFTRDRSMVGEYQRSANGLVTLRFFNPPAEKNFSRREILAIHRVVGTEEP